MHSTQPRRLAPARLRGSGPGPSESASGEVGLGAEAEGLAGRGEEARRGGRVPPVRGGAGGGAGGAGELLGYEGADGRGELEAVAREAVAEVQAREGGGPDDGVDVVGVDRVPAYEGPPLLRRQKATRGLPSGTYSDRWLRPLQVRP